LKGKRLCSSKAHLGLRPGNYLLEPKALVVVRVDMTKRKDEPVDMEATGPGVGMAPTGMLVGGGALGGTADGISSGLPAAANLDTDTGFTFGIGQSTSTGTLPTQGGSNLDGTDPEGTLQVDSRYGAEPPIGHINAYGDARDQADRDERVSD
jgi:hypothetical protein